MRFKWSTHYQGQEYVLNLIDTPGHVDFSYEVSRSIAACEGALLIVDAAQSIQAQTISNLYLALENDLEIIPVLNKVDLPSANPEEVTDDIVELLGCDPAEVIPASAKTGIGIEAILTAIIENVYHRQKGIQKHRYKRLFLILFTTLLEGLKPILKSKMEALKKTNRLNL